MAEDRATNEVRTYLAQRGGSVEDAGGRGLTDEMARAIGVDRPATLTALLREMEDDGVITREMRGLRTYRIALVDDAERAAVGGTTRGSGRMVGGHETSGGMPAVGGATTSPGGGAVRLRDALSRQSKAANGGGNSEAVEAAAGGSAGPDPQRASEPPVRARSLREALSDPASGAVLAPPEQETPPRAGRSTESAPSAAGRGFDEPSPRPAARAVSLRDAIASGGGSGGTTAPPAGPQPSDSPAYPGSREEPEEPAPAWTGHSTSLRDRPTSAPTTPWEASETAGRPRTGRKGRALRPHLSVPVPAVKTAPTTPIMTAVGIAVAGVVFVALITVIVTRGSTSHHVSITGTSSSSEDACRVVTPEEASAAFGSDAGVPNFVLGSCVYDNHTFELIAEVARQNARTLFDASHSSAAQDIPGLGDGAYYVDGRLRVLKGSSMMLLTINPYSPNAPSPKLLALAASAVNRL